MPAQINKQSKPSLYQRLFLRVPLAEKILFTKHLSMMLGAGMTEVDGVRLIRKQIKGRGFGKIMDRIISNLESGQFLSTALTLFPAAFNQLFVSLIKVGEISGTLPENLDHLSKELKKSSQLKAKVRSALIYPLVILVATVGISALLIFFVLPKIIPVFLSLNVELPAETKFMIAASSFLVQYYLFIILGIVALAIILWLLLRIKPIHYLYHRLILMLPIFGKISINYNVANITRSLGIFLKSGIHIVEAVTTTAESTNEVYSKILRQAAEEIKKGQQFHTYLESFPKIFPPTVSRMIEVGENTGQLSENLFYLADFYENEVDEITKNLSSILEPILLVLMGGMVGFVAISIIKPIYSLSTSLTR